MALMEFKKINWLCSFPKSGNTWLRLMLDAYFLGDVDINDIQTSHGDATQIFYQLDNLSATRYPDPMQQLIRPAALIKMVMHFNNSGKQFPMFLKSHFINAQMQSVSLFPIELTHSMIYLVRDPREVLPSYAAHMGMTYDKAITSMSNEHLILSNSDHEQVNGFLSDWGTHVRSFTNANRHNVLLIRYEDMKKEPEQALSRILEHVGLVPDEEKVKKAVKLTKLTKLKQQENVEGFGEQSSHNKEFFGKKHKDVTVKQRRRIESLFGREMKLLGYLE